MLSIWYLQTGVLFWLWTVVCIESDVCLSCFYVVSLWRELSIQGVLLVILIIFETSMSRHVTVDIAPMLQVMYSLVLTNLFQIGISSMNSVESRIQCEALCVVLHWIVKMVLSNVMMSLCETLVWGEVVSRAIQWWFTDVYSRTSS